MNRYSFFQHSMQALADYDESGLHLEKNVLDVAACDELIAVATEFPAVKNGDYRTVLQPHRTSGSFTALLSCPAIVGIMRQILGDKISAIQSQFFYGKPGTPGFQPHQDNRFVNAPAGQFASVWIALTDVSKENGGLYMYPGTHREPLLDVVEVPFEESLLQDRNALRLRCVIPEKYQPVDLSMPRGSAAFFDGSTVHGSHQNNSDRYRYAVLLTYIVRGSPFVAGQYAKREEVPID